MFYSGSKREDGEDEQDCFQANMVQEERGGEQNHTMISGLHFKITSFSCSVNHDRDPPEKYPVRPQTLKLDTNRAVPANQRAAAPASLHAFFCH